MFMTVALLYRLRSSRSFARQTLLVDGGDDREGVYSTQTYSPLA